MFALSALLYVARLGFYSDDWSFLYAMQAKAEPGFWSSLIRLVREDLPTRPGQALLLLSLFRAFGLAPAPYHLFNAAVMAGVVVLFYLALRRLGVARTFAFPAAALYGLLPHYSTDRFWVAAFQAPLSIGFYLVSLLSGLHAVEALRPAARWWWTLAALVTLAGSVLNYEVAVPLILLNAFLWWRHARILARPKPTVLVASNILLLLALSAYKALLTQRMENNGDLYGYVRWLARTAITPFYTRDHGGFNLFFSVFTSYVQDGLLLPWSAWKVATSGTPQNLMPMLLVSAAVGAVIFFSAYSLAVRTPAEGWTQGRTLLVSGIVVFFLGYAIFLTNGNVQFTPTGIANRTAIAAALGVVLSFAGAAGMVAQRVRESWRSWVYSLPLAVMGACGCFIVNGLADSWATAYNHEVNVLQALAAVSPNGPPGQTVLLDGVCPYLGAAPVFESSWDFAGSLSLRYATPRYLRGDVVSTRLVVRPDEFEVTHYLGKKYVYPYSSDLVIFNLRDGRIYPVPDHTAAERYFATVNQDKSNGCPEWLPGHGVTLY
ncbi:MAG: hypothetical protein JWN34_3843 [Bryobacterales bacterium]|nr:hypothetical protein [Bryobacterales bacterium]